ncbi:MAG: hypothetical protein H0T71_11040 [Acidobacteria bacterium]|nr:hypothetical protein [Acidobacteriota bacterium]
MVQPPFVVFRALAPPPAFGRIAVLTVHSGTTARYLTSLACARVHYARGAGLCLVQEPVNDVAEYVAYTFDRTFTRRRRISLRGVPTRARVSPDGRRASVTTYAEEHSAEGERLATKSIVIEIASGQTVADLGEFRIVNDGHLAINGPTDVSSVAFEPDGDRFFATLSTATAQYLVAGSVDERRLTIIRTGAANEALSPDGRHLIVKRLNAVLGFWQVGVIDLRTWVERDLNQGSRSIDDQVEWLDNRHVIYHDVTDDTTGIWMLAIDGVGAPRVFERDAFSATTQR